MTRAEFTKGVMRLAVACQRAADDAVLEVYYDALARQATAEEWETFCRATVASGRFRFFPTVAELVDALHEHRGGRPLDAEAGEAYERVLSSGNYTPNGGTSWDHRTVRRECGRAAAEAFLAAGGPRAFVTTWDEAKTRERFLRAYITAIRSDPGARLLPMEAERRALPAADGPTEGEARALLRRVADLARVAEPAAHPESRGPAGVVAKEPIRRRRKR